ncbi:MAG: class I SAM-dependent methyltransferase [Deltaproteobacteria bacterium]|nr:class I SAM-dependent methyltransferase [Deltaproteobacteria bacterium]
MVLNCPLCNSGSVASIESVKVSELAELYSQMLGRSIIEEFSGHNEFGFFLCGGCDLRFFHPAVTGSEGFYESLQKFDWYYLEDKDEYEFARRYVPENSCVLEIGCGKGAFAKKIDTGNYTGLEFSSKAREMGESAGIRILNETVQAHAVKNAGRYDVVCSFQVLEHIADVSAFLGSSIECLAPGGRYIISVPSADSFISSATNATLNLPPHHVTHWSDKSLCSIASIFDLKMVELYHDKLADIHSRWYSITMAQQMLNAIFRKKKKLIDLSFSSRVLTRLAGILVDHHLAGKQKKGSLPRGHSVTVVYRKPIRK